MTLVENTTSTAVAPAANVTLSDSAAKRILVLREKGGKPNLMLRVTVLGGGCSGFQYALDFVEQANADDTKFEKNGATMLIDETSLPFLEGAVVDFEQTMVKSAFKIRNPNAASGCGCGKSFSV